MAYAWFEDNHSLRLLPPLPEDDLNGYIEFASHGINRVVLSVGGHHGKSRIHDEWQQRCFRELWFQILLTQLPLHSNFLMFIDCAFYGTRTSPIGNTVEQSSVAFSQFQSLWLNLDLVLAYCLCRISNFSLCLWPCLHLVLTSHVI